MNPEAFINAAIAAGERDGVAALDPDQRLVYLIAEAECLADMEGIDAPRTVRAGVVERGGGRVRGGRSGRDRRRIAVPAPPTLGWATRDWTGSTIWS